MKRLIQAAMLIAFLFDTGMAGELSKKFNWWGTIAFRQRHEIYKEYVDISAQDTIKWGTLRTTDNNSKTRLGYKFGFTLDINEYVTAAVTLRSGVGKVMWQDINNENTSGLSPGLQEAYIHWQPPYAETFLGRMPQEGNAMWDLYASSNNIRDPVRQDNPTDGVFNDKMGFLNGVKLLVPVGPVTLRGVYHTDYVGGDRREYASSSASAERSQMDSYTRLGGFSLDIYELFKIINRPISDELNWSLDFDYGKPRRTRDVRDPTPDSTYAEEKLYGAALNIGIHPSSRIIGVDYQFSYGFNSREGIYKSDFYDNKITCELIGFRVTLRYQNNLQEITEGIYTGHKAKRTATHIYLNKEMWGLDIQPRYIRFVNKIAGNKSTTNDRYELTTTIRF